VWCGSAAAPSRGSAVSQILLAIARHLPVMMRLGRSGNAGQCSHRQSKRQYDFRSHVHLRLPSWPRNRWRTPRGANAGTSFPRTDSFQSSDGLTICAASCSRLRRRRRPALPRRPNQMMKARGKRFTQDRPDRSNSDEASGSRMTRSSDGTLGRSGNRSRWPGSGPKRARSMLFRTRGPRAATDARPRQ
jgi:hypothetical protein